MEKGFSIDETKFDRLFFEKGVLVLTEDTIVFRYNCMVEYYLAKKAEQTPEFLSYILSNKNYLNYQNELLYYTGLNRRNTDVVKKMQVELYSYFDRLNGVIEELKDYNIGMDISFPEEKFSQKISKSKLTQEQSDEFQDTEDISEISTPEDINKQITHEEKDAYMETLSIYGSCLKNLELISKKEKEHMYKDYIQGLCIVLGIFKKSTEKFFNDEISDMKQTPEKHSEEDIKKINLMAQDILRISLPIILQKIAFENIGTTKLKSILEDVLDNNEESEFAKFFSVFLFCDLRLPGFKYVLKNYCKESKAKDESLLKIIFFKLLYYYRFRYFSSSFDLFLENTLADINTKLNGGSKQGKSEIIQGLKANRPIINI